MLKGPHKNICVGGIEALDLAHESVIQMHILNLELIAVLSALKGTKFSGWLEDKCGLNCAEEGCRVKNVALKYLGNLNADLNTYMAKLGYYNFMKREDELPFVEVDLKKNTYLAIVNDKTFSDGDRFLSLASYFLVVAQLNTNSKLSPRIIQIRISPSQEITPLKEISCNLELSRHSNNHFSIKSNIYEPEIATQKLRDFFTKSRSFYS